MRFHSKHMDPEHSPLMHNCVPLLQRVLFGIGCGAGHSGDRPLHVEDKLQSDSPLQTVFFHSGTNLQVSLLQQGPWLGLKHKHHINLFRKLKNIYQVKDNYQFEHVYIYKLSNAVVSNNKACIIILQSKRLNVNTLTCTVY